MDTKKVTREELRNMSIGDTITFNLNEYRLIESGKNTAYVYAKILGCRFVCSTDKTESGYTLTITKEAI